jgi:predicted DNA-binding transcriptional regulator AlpA
LTRKRFTTHVEPEDRLVSPFEAARLLGVSRATLDRWVRAGRIPRPVRIGPAPNGRVGHSLKALNEVMRGDGGPAP